jgi:putative transcriptional regulator
MKNSIKSERVRRNWSQQDLAEVLGVSRQTINAIEQGKYAPSLTLAIKLARIFELPIETLFKTT